MEDSKHKVTIIFRGERYELRLRHGVALQILDRECPPLMQRLDCRKAECGLCLIHVREGSENVGSPLFIEAGCLKAMRAEPHDRLACQTRVFGPVTVELTPEPFQAP